ncbi:hypothetical protein HUJ04_007451 [Dendroctonus ponderosae]|uniref:Uncharacterized protein n=3 Tax=Dendroctonus ponderosae TaxID=77166 RepID=A0AAR5PLU1_DENPD|nr:hypothetical protein HUJ04_007451 [Dendroctonus ponderosae]KAH1025468.1 hypothetical protein HUJ05_010190 [Dendroctonus ponderosae]
MPVTEQIHKELSCEEKDAAAFLRERFLFLVASLPVKPSNITMHNNTEVSAQIRAFDLPFENVFVENLQPSNSPAVIPKGILRTSDILTISYKDM